MGNPNAQWLHASQSWLFDPQCLASKITRKCSWTTQTRCVDRFWESLIENWNIIWPPFSDIFFFKRNCSRGSVSLNILSDEWIYARASSWRLWSGDNAYIGPECGTLCLHTLFLPESLLTANNCRLLSHLRTRRGVACLAHLPRVVEINWLEISLGFD